MATTKKSFWLSYDLGLRGNYNGLFHFLDSYDAIECGNGLAYFIYPNIEEINNERLIEKIKNELTNEIDPLGKDRLYIIWLDNNKIRGKFLFGTRRTAPWVGYADKSSANNSDISE